MATIVATVNPQAVDSLREKVQVALRANRIRLEEWFRGFDKLGNKRVTPAQAGRCLDLAKVQISPAELAALGMCTSPGLAC